MQRAFHALKKSASRCKNLSLKQASGLIGGSGLPILPERREEQLK